MVGRRNPQGPVRGIPGLFLVTIGLLGVLIALGAIVSGRSLTGAQDGNDDRRRISAGTPANGRANDEANGQADDEANGRATGRAHDEANDRADTGTADKCPNRNAYCPVDGVGVSRPGGSVLAPSGRFRLDVLPVQPRSASEDWTFRVVDVETGDVVLLPRRPGFDGGIGVVIAWGPEEPDTVWVVDGNQVRRWRHDRATGRWSEQTPASSEPLPEVVQANIRARAAAD